MNTVLSILLTILTTSQYPFFVSDTPERTVYFFCHSRLIDISSEEKQHIVITDVQTKTVNDKQVWDMVTEWTNFVNTEYENDCRRTSDLNHYNSLEEAESHLERQLLKYLDRQKVLVEKVAFEFDTK